jgi:hypothetical protein
MQLKLNYTILKPVLHLNLAPIWQSLSNLFVTNPGNQADNGDFLKKLEFDIPFSQKSWDRILSREARFPQVMFNYTTFEFGSQWAVVSSQKNLLLVVIFDG